MSNKAMIEVVETDSETPLCPHCGKPVGRIYARRIKSKLGVRFVYFCGLCRKTLGVSQRKTVWMG